MTKPFVVKRDDFFFRYRRLPADQLRLNMLYTSAYYTALKAERVVIYEEDGSPVELKE